MDQCDASRVAEIEKAVVEQAHCYLPPRCNSGCGPAIPPWMDQGATVVMGVLVVFFVIQAFRR